MLIAAETTIRPLDAPYSYLRAQTLINFRDYVWVLDNEFQRYHITSSMDTLVGASTSYERRLFRVIRVGFRYCTCINKGFKEVTLNSSLVVISEACQDYSKVPRLLRGYLQLHTLIPSA